MRFAVLGAQGQLGTDVVRAIGKSGHTAFSLGRAEADVTDPEGLAKRLADGAPDAVVNCAAYVRVDEAETQVQTSFAVNAAGALHVARACEELGALCIYVSTDYVFDGARDGPYTEEDPPSPINVYGASKLAGEHLVRQACSHSLIVRTASVFGRAGASGKGGNFVESILGKARKGERLQVVEDVSISPTYTRDAARVIVELAEQRHEGIVHIANSVAERCTWYLMAKRAVELCGLDAPVEGVSADAYPTAARRPLNSALDNARAAALVGHAIPAWDDALRRYLGEKGYLA